MLAFLRRFFLTFCGNIIVSTPQLRLLHFIGCKEYYCSSTFSIFTYLFILFFLSFCLLCSLREERESRPSGCRVWEILLWCQTWQEPLLSKPYAMHSPLRVKEERLVKKRGAEVGSVTLQCFGREVMGICQSRLFGF